MILIQLGFLSTHLAFRYRPVFGMVSGLHYIFCYPYYDGAKPTRNEVGFNESLFCIIIRPNKIKYFMIVYPIQVVSGFSDLGSL